MLFAHLVRGKSKSKKVAMVDVYVETLMEMNAELKEKSELLRIAESKLKGEPKLEDKEEFCKEVMFILAQNLFFESSIGLTIKELSLILKKSEATIRKVMKELIALSLIEQKGERPAYYSIKQKYFEV